MSAFDKNKNPIAVGDYIRVTNLGTFPGAVGRIIMLEDIWCIEQWVGNIKFIGSESKFNYDCRVDCNYLEKMTNEEAMLKMLEY